MYNLARKITDFCKDVDTYGWDDAYGYEGGYEDSINDNYELLIQFDDSIIDYLDSIIDDNDEYYYESALELKNEILKEWY